MMDALTLFPQGQEVMLTLVSCFFSNNHWIITGGVSCSYLILSSWSGSRGIRGKCSCSLKNNKPFAEDHWKATIMVEYRTGNSPHGII